jgi:methionine-rich copper-binding protein CopC
MMNTYRSEASAHRPAFALVAVALTALSLALAVVVPTRHDPVHASAPASLATKAVAPEPITVTISPQRIEVVGRRTQETALEGAPAAQPKRKG